MQLAILLRGARKILYYYMTSLSNHSKVLMYLLIFFLTLQKLINPCNIKYGGWILFEYYISPWFVENLLNMEGFSISELILP